MFQRFAGNPEILEDLDRIERWTRARFGLAEDQIVLVSDEVSEVPGFPESDTIIRIWIDPQTRYRFRIFKAAHDVVEADLPECWLMPALLDDGDPDCC